MLHTHRFKVGDPEVIATLITELEAPPGARATLGGAVQQAERHVGAVRRELARSFTAESRLSWLTSRR